MYAVYMTAFCHTEKKTTGYNVPKDLISGWIYQGLNLAADHTL